VQNNLVDRNIDVQWSGLKKGYPCCPDIYDFGTGIHDEDPNYAYQFVSTTSFKVYLPPWN
jgi:hypothetical protein